MASSGGDSEGLMAVINVTPLVDVMLVLLVIFMITAPILQQGVEVNLPKATTAPLKGDSEQVVLSIDKNNQIFIGSGNKVDLATVKEKIAAIMEQRTEENRKVYIKADQAVSYGSIMSLMSKVHEAGIEQIGLVSDPEK